MKIAVIGAGFTGLASAYELVKDGHEVSVFEKDSVPGGLAVGFKESVWNWTLEKHYHHWFANDASVLSLAKETGFETIIRRPKTSVYVNDKIYQLDSPLHALKFPLLPLADKLRMGIVLAGLKFDPVWKPLEKLRTNEFLIKTMGRKSYDMIWKPQLINKFGSFFEEISLAWFWARIRKRTPSLVYPKGGFLSFAQHLVKVNRDKGVKFFFDKEIVEIRKKEKHLELHFDKNNENFDKVIVTLPSFFFSKLVKNLPEKYKKELLSLKGLGAINLVLRLNKSFLKDGTYWLSVCEEGAPIMAVVEHTNFMDKIHYNSEHLVYLGNYLPADHEYFAKSPQELLKIYSPFLKKINKGFEQSIIGAEVFKVPFAQPIIPVNYSKKVPSFDTPVQNLFLANIQQVYPWDRGTNYAVELGQKIAKHVQKSS